MSEVPLYRSVLYAVPTRGALSPKDSRVVVDNDRESDSCERNKRKGVVISLQIGSEIPEIVFLENLAAMRP